MVVTIQLINEFHVTVNLLRNRSHVKTYCGRKQKKWLTAQSNGHNSQTFVHVEVARRRVSGCQIHLASHELQTPTHIWKSCFFQILLSVFKKRSFPFPTFVFPF